MQNLRDIWLEVMNSKLTTSAIAAAAVLIYFMVSHVTNQIQIRQEFRKLLVFGRGVYLNSISAPFF